MKTTALTLLLLCLWIAWAPHSYSQAQTSQPSGQDGTALASEWPLFRQNLGRTGLSPNRGPQNPAIRWRVSLRAIYSSTTIGDDGTLYIGAYDSVYAFTGSGQRKWVYPVDGLVVSSPTVGPDGSVYIGTRDNKLHGILPDGSRKWAPVETQGEVWSSPALTADGTLYFGSFDSGLYAVNSNTGALIWTYFTNDVITASPAIGPDGTIYVGSFDRGLYALNPDRTLKWPQPFFADSSFASTPAIGSDGTIYAAALDGGLYAINPDGSSKWPQPFLMDQGNQTDAGNGVISSPAIGPDGTIYVGSVDGGVYAINPDGTRKWHFQTGEGVFSSPTVDADGTVYIGSFDQNLYALNAADGSVKWSFPVESPVWSSPTIGTDGNLYFATTGLTNASGTFYALGEAALSIGLDTEPEAGQEVTVTVGVGDFVPTEGTLFYRQGGQTSYQQESFVPGGTSTYEALIPAQAVTLRGLEFYVSFTDGSTTETQPLENAANQPFVEQVKVAETVAPTTLKSRVYQMVSVPLVLDDPSVQSVLEDDLGAHDILQWRLFEWEVDDYNEFPTISKDFTPGNAFFLVTSEDKSFSASDGISVNTGVLYLIDLAPGWNQVGTPFAFPVSWSAVSRDANVVGNPAFWNGTEWIQDPNAVQQIVPWEGYFVFNSSLQRVTIGIPPDETAVSASVVRNASKAAGDFTLQLVASVPGTNLRDTQNWVGVQQGAADGHDALDAVEAPPPGEHVRLSVLEGDQYYARSFKPYQDAGQRWNLMVRSTRKGNQVVDVRLEEEIPIPEGFKLVIADEAGDMISVEKGRFRVALSKERPVRHLQLTVGTPDFLEADDRGETLPGVFVLETNYPNPFNPQTLIGYRIGETSQVVLEVYNVMGQRIRTLVNQVQEAGRYEATWDGRVQSGETAASGLYFYRLSADDFKATKNMLLLR